jgi:AP-3 complex subunit delta-1
MRSHPRVVAEHKDLVIQCLEDDDTTVRLQALELLTGMVSRSNLTDIVWKLMEHVRDSDADTVYRDELIKKILFICSRDHYKYV